MAKRYGSAWCGEISWPSHLKSQACQRARRTASPDMGYCDRDCLLTVDLGLNETTHTQVAPRRPQRRAWHLDMLCIQQMEFSWIHASGGYLYQPKVCVYSKSTYCQYVVQGDPAFVHWASRLAVSCGRSSQYSDSQIGELAKSSADCFFPMATYSGTVTLSKMSQGSTTWIPVHT